MLKGILFTLYHNKMHYTLPGKSNLRISKIGFGCMSLKSGNGDAIELIKLAISRGINYFDTADLYDKGENEVMLGQATKANRSAVIIATKVGNQWNPNGDGWQWNPSKKYILEAVDASLRRLQTDYIDVYQLHGGTIADPIDETIEAFEILQQRGKILHYGISSIRPNVISAYVQRSHIISVMMQYSLLDRRPEEACLPLLLEHNIGVLARGSVAGGLLAGKPPKPYLNYNAVEVAKAAQAISAQKNNHPAETAIKYTLMHPAISAAVVGIRTKQQLMEAINAEQMADLTAHDLTSLQNAINPNRYSEHR